MRGIAECGDTKDCNAGAALFLHCRNPEKDYTAGCVAIPEEDMIAVMQSIKAGCIIVIESEYTLTAIA